MSDYEDIMDLLGPSVTPFDPSSQEVSRPAPPTVRDTTSEANVWLPTSVAAHYKEYDRFGPAVDELEALIARDGLLTPIRISTDGEVAVVHEGNHRLQVAERLGISEVPAIVTFDSPVFSNEGRVTPLEPVLGSWVEQNRGRLRSFWGHRTAGDYFMDHRPAGPDYGGPMHDVSDFFPDIENLPTRMYDFGEPGSQGSIRQIIDAQGNPNKSVMIYRAVPKGADPIIRNGDWVSISREYAEQHGMSNVGGVYDILSATVQAKDIWTDGNSVNEWGYHGPELRTARTYTALVEDGSEYLRTPGARIDWNPSEAPFDGIWFGFNGRDQTFASYYHAGKYDEEYYLLNKAWSDERIAKLQWTPSGEVAIIWTKTEYRRIGLATALFNWTKANISPGLRHSDDMTSSGYEWAKSMGHDPENWELVRALPHYASPTAELRSAHRTAGTRTDPGGVYRGINVQVLSHDEQQELAEWANVNAFSMYDYQLAEPNYELVYRILDRLDSGGLGRHWSKDYDVSADFARDQGDGIELILIGHWEGEGVDTREFHRGYDGIQRPSNLPHEEEVTLYPGTPVTLVGMDIVTETGFTYNIPVPNIQVTAGHDMKHLASRTAAEPGGVLPWNPSHRGYTWITHSDGTLEAVTNDGVNRMFLTEEPWGWEWEVYDSLGFVEGGTFGMALKGGDALRDRANDLLSEFDSRAERRTRGPSRGYQDDYTQAPNTLWSKREAWSNSPWADYDFDNPTYAPYGPLTLYRGFSFEANPGVADQLLERLKSGEPVVKVFEDALIESRYSAMQFGDRVGVYWTTDKDYALNLAMVDSNLDDHVGLYIQAHWEGGDHDIDFGKGDRKNYWGNESEVRLLPGTEVKGEEVGIYVGGRWHTSGTGQSFTAERTSPLSARKTTSERYAERLRREGRR